MKNILLALGLLLCASASYGQNKIRLGLEAGAQLHNGRYGIPVTAAAINNYPEVQLERGYYQPRLGERAGMVAAMDLNTKWAVQTGLFFNTKGFRQDSVLTFGATISGKPAIFYAEHATTLYYLDLPLNIAYNFSAGKGFSVAGGPYVSWLLSGTRHRKPMMPTPDVPSERQKLSVGNKKSSTTQGVFQKGDDFRPLDAGLQAGVAYTFSSGFYLKAEGQLGLVNVIHGHDLFDWDFSPLGSYGFIRNRSASLHVGYYFGAKKR